MQGEVSADKAISAVGENSRGKRLTIALICSFMLLLLAGGLAVQLAFRSMDAERLVVHTLEVRQVNLKLLNAVQYSESQERGFLITNDDRYIQRFEDARREIGQLQEQLQTLTADNPPQQARIAEMKTTIDAKTAELTDTLRVAREDSRDAAVNAVRSHWVNNLMDKVRQQSTAIDQDEDRLLGSRREAAQQSRSFLVLATLVSLLISSVIALFVSRSLRGHAQRAEDIAQRLANEMHEREVAEDRLRQAQKMDALGKLTGGVAHDFNNMLAVIVGSLDIALRRIGETEEGPRRLIKNAQDSAKRAAVLTHRLLAFSRLQPLAPKPLDVNKSVNDIAEMLRRTLGEQISIEMVQSGGVWPANIDQPQLESALLNLAVNARDAMPPTGGKLTIETANTYLDRAYVSAHPDVKAGQYVVIAMTDTGSGMKPDVIAQAFDPFFTTKPVGAGTGLGLSQVHGFIKQSGGHVSIYSEVGVGTTVKLYFPRYLGAVREEITQPVQPKLKDRANVTVLVVEDEEGVRRFAVEALKELGYQVLDARSAKIALQLLETRPEVQLLLTDVVMADMNGRKLVDEVLVRWPKVKALYMTGYTRNAIVHNGVLDAGTHLLTKPFTLAQLETELRALLQST